LDKKIIKISNDDPTLKYKKCLFLRKIQISWELVEISKKKIFIKKDIKRWHPQIRKIKRRNLRE
jgi:hypothetical protein